MSCVIIGTDLETAELGLSEAPSHPPETVRTALQHASSAIIIGIRFLMDRDISLLDHLPVTIALTSAVDITHLAMHLRDRRITLTPRDRILVPNTLATHHARAPWLKAFATKPDNARDLLDLTGTLLPAPDGFEALPKAAFLKMALQMAQSELIPATPVVACSENCRSLIGCCFDAAEVLLVEEHDLAPDVIFAAPSDCGEMLARHPQAHMMVCPALIDSSQPLEVIHQKIAIATRQPIQLLQARAIDQLAGPAALAGLVYQIG